MRPQVSCPNLMPLSPRTVTLVVGYHQVTPPAPTVATAQGLDSRVALVLDSYRPDSADAYFDAPLWCASVNAAAQVLEADCAELLNLTKRSRWRKGEQVETLSINHFSPEDWLESPPKQVRWYRDGALVAVGVSEFWVQVGGPEPYHDSYTFSWFVAQAQVEGLLETLRQQIGFNGRISDVIHAGQGAV